MAVDYYYINTRVFIFDEPIVDTDIAAEGIALLIRSMGKSPVSKAVKEKRFDIETDSYRTYFRIRYVDCPNLNIIVDDSKVSIGVRKM